MRAFVLLLTAAVPVAATAHEPRHVAAHVHGEALLELAVDGATMTIRLEAPGIGILDFERAPRTDVEQAAVDRAIAVLKTGDWLVPAVRAQCTLKAATSAAQGYQRVAAPPAAPDTVHPTDHAHAHAGFIATLQWQCASPNDLRYVDVRLPDQFPALHQTVVQMITASGQGRAVVSRGNTRVSLER